MASFFSTTIEPGKSWRPRFPGEWPLSMASYHKLKAEQQRNSETIAAGRSWEKSFQKMCRDVLAVKRKKTANT